MSNVKGVFERKFLSPVENGPQNGEWLLGQKVVYRLTFGCATPKGTSLRGAASFDVFCVKIRAGVLAVDDLKNPPKNEKKTAE